MFDLRKLRENPDLLPHALRRRHATDLLPEAERLLGLEPLHIQVLMGLRTEKNLSLIELAGQTDSSDDLLKKALSLLEDKRLVRRSRIGRTSLFRRVMDLPKLHFAKVPIVTEEVETSEGEARKPSITEADVRKVLTGFWEDSEVEEFKPFFYPVYRATLILQGKKRVAWLDGRTGEELDWSSV